MNEKTRLESVVVWAIAVACMAGFAAMVYVSLWQAGGR